MIYASSGTSFLNSTAICLSNTIWSNRNATYGAAIQNQAELSLQQTAFVENTATGFGGAIFHEGTDMNIQESVFHNNTANWGGGALCNKAPAHITNDTFVQNSAYDGGAIENWSTLNLNQVKFSDNSATYGGALYHGIGSAVLKSVDFSENSAIQGGAILNWADLSLLQCTFHGNTAQTGGALLNQTGATLSLTDVYFQTVTDTIVNFGSLSFSGVVSLSGTLRNYGSIHADNACIILNLSPQQLPYTTAMIDNLAPFSTAEAIVLKTCPVTEDYWIASGAKNFTLPIMLDCKENTPLQTLEDVFFYQGTYYERFQKDDNLWLKITNCNGTPQRLSATAESAEWYSLPEETCILQLSQDDFQHSISFQTTSNSTIFHALPQGQYQWRIRYENTSEWNVGSPILSQYCTQTPQLHIASQANATHLLFANPSALWEPPFYARHEGCPTTWKGTGEYVSLAGKNRFQDVFLGNDANCMLILTDTPNGDAFFLDDIFSPFPTESPQHRIENINSIYAGSGNDIIDLTSQRFSFSSPIAVHGGSGDDVIWGNRSTNVFFGEEDDDRLIGGPSADVFIGGQGNDSMHGGGGSDFFFFENDWGQDSIRQLTEGQVILCFQNGKEDFWNPETLCYSDGINSVQIQGTRNVTVRFQVALQQLLLP